jgi:hypothetical protein
MRTTPASPAARPAGRTLATRLACATALLLGAATTTAALADVSTPILSGLGWRSGSVVGGFPCLAQLRGRTLDVNHIFIIQSTFPAVVSQAGGCCPD